MNLLDRVKNRLQPSPELSIVPVVEALEVNLEQIEPRTQILEDFGCGVPIRDKPRRQAGGSRFPKNRDTPFRRDEWFVSRC